MCKKKRQLSLKEIEDAAKEVFKSYPYPRPAGNGLYELAPGVFGNEQALQLFTDILKKNPDEIRKYELVREEVFSFNDILNMTPDEIREYALMREDVLSPEDIIGELFKAGKITLSEYLELTKKPNTING